MFYEELFVKCISQNPTEPGIGKKKYPPITYEYAQEEIAAKAGIQIASSSGGDDVAMLQVLSSSPLSLSKSLH